MIHQPRLAWRSSSLVADRTPSVSDSPLTYTPPITRPLQVPLLFIYYDVPSHAYQDKIISTCTATFALLMFHAAHNTEMAPVALLSLLFTLIGMAGVNISGDLRKAIGPAATTAPYWGQTAAMGVFLVMLVFVWYVEERTTAGRRAARKRK